MPFCVPIIESERGWGQKVDDRYYFRDGDKAFEFRSEFNSKNTEEKVPDVYWYAEEPYHVGEDKVPVGTVYHDDPKNT